MINNAINRHTILEKARVATITQQLYARRNIAYICVDTDWKVIEVSENLSDFGFSELTLHEDVTDQVDFLVGVQGSDTILDLPMISSPNGIPIRATLIPSDNMLSIVIMDAHEEFLQQKQVQQKANENELLLGTQQKLMTQLENAKQQLQKKNEQLQEAARLQLSFLSGVSHEFRTPLSSIIGYTNLLLNRGESLAKQSASDYLSAVKRSSKHLLSLIENLLDHGKYDSNEIVLNPKITSLSEVFKDVELLVLPLAETKSIDFNLNLNNAVNVNVLVDDSRLRQCLINIIGNAIKFTDAGSVTVNAKFNQDSLTVIVTDTGVGINDKDLEKIKLPFWQAPDTGKSGTGLGLTITEKIIEMMGGSLLIESDVGKGSVVTFDVLAPQIADDKSDVDVVELVHDKPLNLLLAEDDDDIANLVVLLLQENGTKVTRVENGALAVESVQNGDYDLVLMDLHMPVLSGYDAIKAIREQDKDTPIVIMTASAIDADRSRAQELGCDAYLVKPVDVSDILQLAGQLVLNK